ncbi:SpoIIE family protein phosphatase [Bernardetia sp.]|uniref:SpoIIE family protein phosphatase n=1 Tax=Bernardetia sp. TaxID=1937974 RepID=UPI0025BB0402|nr:SpoIIE family protein phosphatase [Bernardetia sp.]
MSSSFIAKGQVGKPFIYNYTSKEYKAHVQNWSLTQDSRGVMYVGNGDGVLEFDGQNWRIIPIDGKGAGFSILNKKQGINDTIYIGSVDEFGYLLPTSTNYLAYTSLRHLLDSTLLLSRIAEVYQQKNEVIFYCSSPSLGRSSLIIENEKVDTISYTSAYPWKFQVAQQLYYWSRPKGLQKLSNKEFIDVENKGFYENAIIDFIFPKTNTTTLIGLRRYEVEEDNRLRVTSREIYEVPTETFETAMPKDVTQDYPQFLSFLKKVNFGLSSYSKMIRLKNQDILVQSSQDGLFILDEQGNIKQNINEQTGLLSNAIYEIMLTDKGNLFVAMNKGISHVEIASPISFWDKSTGLDGVVETIHHYEGRTYVGTHQGLFYLDGYKAKKVQGDTPLNTQTWSFVRFAPQNPDGTTEKEMLLVSDNNGIHQISDSTAKRVLRTTATPYEFYKSKKSPNRIFLLHGNGIRAMNYKDGKWELEEYISDLQDDIRMAAEDKEGNIWLGSFRNGAIKIPYYENPDEVSADQIKYYKEDKGFASLKNVLVYPFQDEIIFATEKGIYKYDKATDRMILAPKLEGTSLTDGSRDIFSFQEGENGNLMYAGLQSSSGAIGIAKKQADGSYELYETPFKKIPEMMVLAHYLAPDGTMWFGGSEGVFRYDPKADSDYYTARNILIRKVQIGKDSIVYGGFAPKLPQRTDEYLPITLKEDLAYKFNSITFEFALPSFGEGNSLYRYRLKGFNEEWSDWTTDSKAIYTNLYEGDYIFEVEGKNIYGKVSNVAAYSFAIQPPMYRHWFAYVLYGLLGVALIWSAVKWNTRRLEKDKEKLEAIVEERTAEIQQQKEEIEQQANNVMLANAEINQQKEEIEAQAESLVDANLAIQKQNQEIILQKEEVEKSYKNIQVLSEIGQKITQILNQEDLVKTVYKNVNSLMPAEFFGIGLHNPKLQRLEFSGFIENGEELPFHYDRLEETESKAVISFTKQEEIIENNFHAELEKVQEQTGEELKVKIGQVPQSFVYLPLLVEQKPVGVITVQSLEKNAYGEKELTVLRTLAAYTSIALDNVSAYKMIEDKNRNITDSIRYANTIQGAVLPHQNEFDKQFNEYFILYNPKDIVSGDFYWLVEKEDITYLATIDCTGHGVPGAFMSMIGYSILMEIINEIPKITPASILEELDKRLVKALHQNQESNNDGMDVCLCAFHKETEARDSVRVEFAGAKRALYYTIPNAEKQELETLKGTRRSIGGKQKVEKAFENNEINVPKDTVFYLTTDGYVDQNSPSGEKIGTLKFLDILKDISDKPLVEQYLQLVSYLDNFQQTTEQRDDITIIGVKV